MTKPGISAVIVNYNGGPDLIDCIASLKAQSAVGELEIIVIDNASRDGSPDAVRRRFPDVTVVASDRNVGFPAAANRGAKMATGDTLLFLNPDVVLEPGCLAAIARSLTSDLTVAAPELWVETTGRFEYGLIVDWVGYPVVLTERRRPLFVPGCALGTRRSTFDELGGFDARYFAFGEDLDYCWRALIAGGEVGISAGAKATHRGGAATPGGYLRDGTIQVTDFRVAMRERNVLATRIKCLPARSLPAGIAAQVAWILCVAVGSAAMGRFRLARELVGGLGWNASNLAQTLRLRHSTRAPQGRMIAITGRIHRGLYALTLVGRHGLPRFVG